MPGWAKLLPQSLHDALLTSDSATAVLERLCGGPVTVRRLSPDRPDPASPCASLLAAKPGETVLRRHVELLCGGRAVSEAELWYVATRLPEEMALSLATTQQPFGRVVAGLALRRHSLSARLCDASEAFALEHRARLAEAGGQVVAVVHERYSWALFGGS